MKLINWFKIKSKPCSSCKGKGCVSCLCRGYFYFLEPTKTKKIVDWIHGKIKDKKDLKKIVKEIQRS